MPQQGANKDSFLLVHTAFVSWDVSVKGLQDGIRYALIWGGAWGRLEAEGGEAQGRSETRDPRKDKGRDLLWGGARPLGTSDKVWSRPRGSP